MWRPIIIAELLARPIGEIRKMRCLTNFRVIFAREIRGADVKISRARDAPENCLLSTCEIIG